MYLSKKDLTHLTRQVCICPEDVPDCPCPLQPPPDCCYTSTIKRGNEARVIPALHARSCPPSGVICHLTSNGIECIPCIEKRIICPLNERENNETIICLASEDGLITCPSCPQCQPCKYKRDVGENSAIWCPPCFPPHPPNCPQCWYDIMGRVQCPSCPSPPVSSTKPPLPSHTFCPLSKKYCIANPDGTYICPGCGPLPVTLEV
uniref:Uncharacterized protein n=1 Tax=Kwoniella pini CBS 10737 TaxID=1296096 RepID=A0A1B9I2W7_9TREE|nr:uncharacterized protein I206_04381 [Kwoniella pini CBS 10737]OCF49854.1 hypothetical protein I206_04381 [Kwoniella pini CBS 10737]